MIVFVFQCVSRWEVPFVSQHEHQRMHWCGYYGVCLHMGDKPCVCVSLKFDDSACHEAPIVPMSSAESLAAAQGCCSYGRHMNIWNWDRQELACCCTADNMQSSTTRTSVSSPRCCHGARNCICNNTCRQGLWETPSNCSRLCSFMIMCN